VFLGVLDDLDDRELVTAKKRFFLATFLHPGHAGEKGEENYAQVHPVRSSINRATRTKIASPLRFFGKKQTCLPHIYL